MASSKKYESEWKHDRDLLEIFRKCDKDGSGTLSREDLMLMLLSADKDDKKSAKFKYECRFLIQALKDADKDGDSKITFEEFKAYIDKAPEPK